MSIKISYGLNKVPSETIVMPFTIKDNELYYPKVMHELTDVFGVNAHDKLKRYLKNEANPVQQTTLVVHLGKATKVLYTKVMFVLDLGEGLVQTLVTGIIKRAIEYDYTSLAIPLPRCDNPFSENEAEVARLMLQELKPFSHLFEIHIVLHESQTKAFQYFFDQGLMDFNKN